MKINQIISESSLNEFAPGENGGGGDFMGYIKALAYAWYTHDIRMLKDIIKKGGSPMKKIIDAQVAVEKILNRGIHCPDGKIRKYYIDYDSDFDGVDIASHDFYEYTEYGEGPLRNTEVDGRTGKPWSPYDHFEFKGNHLGESVNEGDMPSMASHRANSSDKQRYTQAARDVVKGADPEHIARVRGLDPELLKKHTSYAWDKVNSGHYKLNRPNLEEEQDMEEGKKPGLWANIHAKQERIKHGSGEHMRKPGSKGAPTADAFKKSATESIEEGYDPVELDWHRWSAALYPDGDGAYALELAGADADTIRNILTYVKQNRQVLGQGVGDTRINNYKTVKDAIIDIKKEFPDLYQSAQQPQSVAEGSTQSKLQPGTHVMLWLGPKDMLPNPPRDDKKYWDKGVVVDEPEMMTGSWQVLVKSERKGQSPISPQRVFILKQQDIEEGENWSKYNHKRVGGMSKKSVNSYRRSHPGSKIQTAVTTKPSKLKKGSKAAKRRASFCARMKGMKKHRTGAKTARDPNSNINKSLRRWHCESIEEMQQMIENAQDFINSQKQLNEMKKLIGKK